MVLDIWLSHLQYKHLADQCEINLQLESMSLGYTFQL